MSKTNILTKTIGVLSTAVVLGTGIACAIPQSRNAILDGLSSHSQVYKDMSKENTSLKEEKEDLLAQKITYEALANTYSAQVTTLTGEKQTLESDISSLRVQLSTSETDKAEIQTQLDEKTLRLAEVELQIQTLNSTIDDLESQNIAFEELVETYSAQVTTLTGEKQALQSDISSLSDQLSTAEASKAQIQTQLDEKTSRLAEVELQVETLNSTINGLNSQIETLNLRIDELNERLGTISTQIDNCIVEYKGRFAEITYFLFMEDGEVLGQRSLSELSHEYSCSGNEINSTLNEFYLNLEEHLHKSLQSNIYSDLTLLRLSDVYDVSIAGTGTSFPCNENYLSFDDNVDVLVKVVFDGSEMSVEEALNQINSEDVYKVTNRMEYTFNSENKVNSLIVVYNIISGD